MHHLSIDIETYSDVNLPVTGLYKYVQSANFKVLLFAWSEDNDPVQIVDLEQGESVPQHITEALMNPFVVKHAYNAAFEWYCLSKYLNLNGEQQNLWLAQWQCTMLHGMYCGYTAGLAVTAEVLGLPQNKRKMTEGKALIKYFCSPCKPTKSNGERTRNLPRHEPERWNLFKAYCKQDVAVEQEILKKLATYPVPAYEIRLWALDQRINARGIMVDTNLIDGALTIDDITTYRLNREAVELSGLNNPNSVAQLKTWLIAQGEKVESLTKDDTKALIKETDKQEVKRMLELRLEMSKTSVKKYSAMRAAICDDNRIRGLLQFYGANRTGRWAGRLVQVHNLPRNYLPTLSTARKFAKQGNTDMLRFIYGNVPDTLSQLIRTAFVPKKGHLFVIADFSAIEARVIAWLAGEQWRQEVFTSHGKIYEASASQMFGVPIEKIVKGNPEYALRQKGKIAELALGYQGGPGALISMGALEMGLNEAELPEIVSRWRQSNKRIVDLWYSVGNAAISALNDGAITVTHGIQFALEGDAEQWFLTVLLPSGRKLYYVKPFLIKNSWGKDEIVYNGVNQTSKKWENTKTYGGKLVENIVQAIARDCLAVALDRLDTAGYETVMHIHDEIVAEVPEEQADLKDMCRIMCAPIEWAPGLVLNADGFVSEYYKKD